MEEIPVGQLGDRYANLFCDTTNRLIYLQLVFGQALSYLIRHYFPGSGVAAAGRVVEAAGCSISFFCHSADLAS